MTISNVHYIDAHRVYAAADAVSDPDVARIAGPFRRDDGLWYERDAGGLERPINLVAQTPIRSVDNGDLHKYFPNIIQANHTVNVPTDTPTLLLPEENKDWSDFAFTLNYPNDWTFNNGQPVEGATGPMRVVPNAATKNLEIYVATAVGGATGTGTGGGATIVDNGDGTASATNADNSVVPLITSLDMGTF